MKLKKNPAPPEYVDVILWDVMDEPAEVSILVDGQLPRQGQLQVVASEEEGDGWKTHYRVQLNQ